MEQETQTQIMLRVFFILLPLVISNEVCIQWGNYIVTATETLTWTISFSTSFYCLATSAMHNSTTNYYTLNRFPYNCTKSGFTHAKASSTDGHIYWIAVGK